MKPRTFWRVIMFLCVGYLSTPCVYAEPVAVTILTDNGGRVDWSPLGTNLIAFDRMGADGYFDVWTMRPNTTDQRCLTCQATQLPQRHIGNPGWHPSGAFIVFQAQKAHVPKLVDTQCTPGAGVLNDLWLMTADGARFWKLYGVSDEVSRDSQGVLHPHFSHDGKRLIWSERVKANGRPFGEWVMRLADFSVTILGPRLSNIRTINPSLVSSFYETHNFSRNNRYFLFTGNQHGSLEIYEYDRLTTLARRLTRDLVIWDEHAHYNPLGTKIVWMSSKGLEIDNRLKTELWIMDRSGLNKTQLTFFNDPGHPHYLNKEAIVAGDSAWSPDGRHIIVTLIDADPNSQDRDKGMIAIVTLN